MEANSTKYEYTGVLMPLDIKTEVRVLAAQNGISLARMALQLIRLGLKDYLAGKRLEGVAP